MKRSVIRIWGNLINRSINHCIPHSRKLTQRIPSSHFHSRKLCIMTETNEKKEDEEQVVNIETVVAKDNKGIDYMKLIGTFFYLY